MATSGPRVITAEEINDPVRGKMFTDTFLVDQMLVVSAWIVGRKAKAHAVEQLREYLRAAESRGFRIP